VGEHLAPLTLDRQFDYIWAFSVLIHLEDEIFYQLINFVARQLRPDGVFYANVDTVNLPDGVWQEFPGVRRPLSFYEQACVRNGLRMVDIGSLADFGHHSGGEADQQRVLEIRPS
jgi:SAM-dependent methyltransferase